MYNNNNKEKIYLKNSENGKIKEFFSYQELIAYVAADYGKSSFEKEFSSWCYDALRHKSPAYINDIIIQSYTEPKDENRIIKIGNVFTFTIKKKYFCYKEDGAVINLKDSLFAKTCYKYYKEVLSKRTKTKIKDNYWGWRYIYGEFRKDPVGRLQKSPHRCKIDRNIKIYIRPTNINFQDEENWDIDSYERTWKHRSNYRKIYNKDNWKNYRKHQWK